MNKKRGFYFLIRCIPKRRNHVFAKLAGLLGQNAFMRKEEDGKSIMAWFETNKATEIRKIRGVLSVEEKDSFD